MIQCTNIRLQFGARVLFEDVNVKFAKGNCYGIIGANGSGKSTFLKLLIGEISPSSGEISISKKERLSVLEQNQNAYNDRTVIETVMLGNKRIVDIMNQKEALYAKENFTEADGIRAGNLENEFAELGGWEAESEAENLLVELGIDKEDNKKLMKDVEPKQKVKVLLAKSLFMSPDILILDEPTNNLDAKTVNWLEEYLIKFENTVIVVSHNRYFLNRICTHICDIDYSKINMFSGNYDMWYQTSELIIRQMKEQNKKSEQRAKELNDFIARFSANASKSKQATSRKKELEKLEYTKIQPSSRKYPFIDFRPEREVGNDILIVDKLTKKGFFEDVSFIVSKEDKIGFMSDRSPVITMLFKILSGEEEPDSGTYTWGSTITVGYLPENNDEYFMGCDMILVDWLSQFANSKDKGDEAYLRGWLGRMLFTGEESQKKAKVISGGEKVRCMLSRAMLKGSNVLIFDEPTNHLDLESIESLNKGMVNFKGPILFTSHDHELMQTVANRIIVINKTKEFDRQTSYNDYLDI